MNPLGRPRVDASRVVIRRLREDDVERFFEPAARDVARQWLAQQERAELHVAVAEVDGAPVGHGCLSFRYFARHRVGYTFAVSVRAEWRSRGVGSLILLHLGRVARERGYRALRCAIDKANPRSRAWHERLRYRVIGEKIVRWTAPDGREVALDSWILERPLVPLFRWRLRLERVLDALRGPAPPRTSPDD